MAVDLAVAAGVVAGCTQFVAAGLCRAQDLESRLGRGAAPAVATVCVWPAAQHPVADGRRHAGLRRDWPVAGLAAGAQQPEGTTAVGRDPVFAVRRAGV